VTAIIEIRADPKRPDHGWLSFGYRNAPCRLGRAGLRGDKREGDGATPVGRFPLRRVFYRSDRLDRPATRLPTAAIASTDAWCDDPAHPLYNRPVTLPFAGRHERLWRDDHAYDVLVVLGHNDDPPAPGLGSAIFLHLAHDDGRPTAGCVALARADLLTVLAAAAPDTTVVIHAA
jgi:L,D-peptidoglycan transpeptidase YkuD (ErfK/YbiS/YcfS/YnhG family)